MTTLFTAANRTWLVLLMATGITWWLGESGTATQSGTLAVTVMLGLAFIKGALVILDFMELRHAPTLWKLIMIGWLTVVLGLIALAYRMSLH